MHFIGTLLSSTSRRVAVQLGVAALLIIGAAGCHLGQPNSSSFASVIIENRPEAEIATATTRVFGADGWRGGPSTSDRMVFEKEASRGTSMSRSGIYATQQGASSIYRVKVKTVQLAGGAHRLQAEAFVVSDAGDSFWEDEVRLTNMRSGPYQDLLNKVAAQLNVPKSASAQPTQP